MNNAVKGGDLNSSAPPGQPSGVRQRDRTRFRFASFLLMGFLLASGLALSVAYLSLNGVMGAAGQLDLPAAEANSAVMTYIGASIMAAIVSLVSID